MAVTLIVEDGTNVEGANSYASIDQLRLYAENRGLSLPDSDDELAQMCIIAMDYLEALEYKLKGSRTYEDQPLSWPRQNVSLRCTSLPSNTIPNKIVNALCQLTSDATVLDGNLTPTQTEFAIKSEVIGPMSTTYAVSSNETTGAFQPVFTKFDQLMRGFFVFVGGTYR